jgi:serine/threonine protein kinase
MTGRTVLQYQILEKLGAGGMGEVYKALDTKLNRFVVLKVLPAVMSADPERRRRFLQEAQAASALNHPNIITIYDIITDASTEYMVVEYVDGKTLLELIPKEGLRSPLAIQYATQIAAALRAAHAAGIIHRDLKPANVMVTSTGLVKLLDFGLAKMVDRTPVEDTAKTATVLRAPVTVEGSIMGTVNYMSPEQAEGKNVDARSDLFSFGSVLYEMLTGRSAFSGSSAISTLSAVLRDNVQPMVELTHGVPPRLEQIVLRCLEKDPARRFQSAEELETALMDLDRPTVSAMLPPPVAPRPERSSKMPAILAACVLVLGAAGVGLWWMTKPRPLVVTPAQPSESAVSKPSPIPPPPETQPSATSSTPPPPAALPPTPAAPATVKLPDGMPIALVLADDVPLDAKTGDAVPLKTAGDVRVDNTVVIAKGAAASGVIVDTAKKRILGLGGKMTFRLESVDALDGHKVNIRATPKPRGNGSKRPMDRGALAAGSEYTGYVDGSNTVSVRK